MIEYQKILDKNMINVLKDILKNIRDNGLSNNNHLYITFLTNNKNVEFPNNIRLFGNIIPNKISINSKPTIPKQDKKNRGNRISLLPIDFDSK